jgi:hypothetical protein
VGWPVFGLPPSEKIVGEPIACRVAWCIEVPGELPAEVFAVLLVAPIIPKHSASFPIYLCALFWRWRRADLSGDGGFNPLAILVQHTVAQRVELLRDVIPQERLLRSMLGLGLSEADQISHVSLPWLTINARALDKDSVPVNVGLVVFRKMGPIDLALA